MTKQVTIKWPPTERTIAIAVLITCVVVYNLFCLWGLTLEDPSGGVIGFMCELIGAGAWAVWILKKDVEDRDNKASRLLYKLGYDWCYHDDKWKNAEDRKAEREARYAEISIDHRIEREYNEQS